MDGDHRPDKAMNFVYRVTSNGSVVMETLYAGTDHADDQHVSSTTATTSG